MYHYLTLQQTEILRQKLRDSQVLGFVPFVDLLSEPRFPAKIYNVRDQHIRD